ncbi:MAG: translocation/assembly module TamB [Brevinematales bacterium]|nr:translocation/assembly module TamB [Brevinematales bacterium]
MLIILLFIFSLYFLIFLGSNLYLYINKSKIEKIIADALIINKVNIRGMFSIPFLFIKIGEVKLSDSEGMELKLRNTKVFYNIFKFNTLYPAEAFYLIKVERVFFTAEYRKASGYLKKLFEKYPVFYVSPAQQNLIKIKNIYVDLSFFPDIKASFYLTDFNNYISHNLMSFNGLLFSEVNQSHRINFIESVFDFSINLGIIEGSNFVNVSSLFNISNVIVGGVPLIENESFRFVSTNLPDIKEDLFKNVFYVKNLEKGLNFEVKRNFNINYPEKSKYYLLEYLMPKGEYFANLNCLFKNENFDIVLFVSNINAKDRFKLNFSGDDLKKKLNIQLNTYLFKNFNASINFAQNTDGAIDFDLLYIKQRLRGKINFIYDDNVLRIFSENLRLNDINFYGFDSYFYFDGKNINIKGIDRSFGLVFNGAFSNGEGELRLKIKNSFMSDSYSFLNGDNIFKVSFNPFRLITFSANLKAFDRVKKEIFASDLKFDKDRLTISKFSILNLLNINLIANFSNTNIIMSGNIDINKNKIPLAGSLVLKRDFSLDRAFLIFDKRILLNITNERGKYNFKFNTQDYNIKKFGIDGIVNLNFSGLFSEWGIEEGNIKGEFNIPDYDRFFISSRFVLIDKTNSYYEIPVFSIENSENTLLGKGIMGLSDTKRFVIAFIRGGKIDFAYRLGRFILEADIQKFLVKNPIFKEKRNLFLNLKTIVKKENIYDDLSINGNFFVYDTKLPEYFSFKVDNFIIKKDDVNIVNAKLTYNNFNLSASINGNNDKFVVNGKMIYDNIFSADYVSTIVNKGDGSYNALYRIYNINPSGILEDISGRVAIDYPYLMFYSESINGLNGHINLSKNKKDWKIDFLNKNFELFTRGIIDKEDISISLIYSTSLYFVNNFLPLKFNSGHSRGNIMITGDPENPDINGVIELYNLSSSINYSRTQITNFNATLQLTNSYMFMNKIIVPTKTGNFLLNGYVDIRDVFTPYFDIKITPVNQKSFVSVNYNERNLSLSGRVFFNEIQIAGNKNRINLKGDLKFDNFSASLPITSFFDTEKLSFNGDLPENVNLNLILTIGNNNKFSTPLNQFLFKKNSILYVNGEVNSLNIKVKGNIGIERGDFTYLSKNFIIKEGNLIFNGEDYIPSVDIVLWYRYRDFDKENVDIYLTFEGKATKIILKDFYSVPERPKNELALILGIGLDNKESVTNIATSDYLKTGVGVAENLFFFNPLSLEIKRRIGLDVFSFRSTILQNYVESGFGRNTNTDFRDYISGSGIVMGKYIFPMLFFEYELYFEKDPYSVYGLIPLHSLGLELDLPYFDVGWKYQPYDTGGKDRKYEQLLEFKFMRKF